MNQNLFFRKQKIYFFYSKFLIFEEILIIITIIIDRIGERKSQHAKFDKYESKIDWIVEFFFISKPKNIFFDQSTPSEEVDSNQCELIILFKNYQYLLLLLVVIQIRIH